DIDTENPELSKYTLVIRTPSEAGVNAINTVIDKNLLLEIYTPLNSTAQLDNTIFYEIGPRYPITNGEHTVTSGTIRKGDTYFKTRTYNLPEDLETSYTFLVEDFNFSDFYDSKFTEYGRARSYFDTPENKKFMADIRYSYELVADSRINLLNRFYPENKVSFDSRYGGIKKLFQRDNTLVCIQETKVGYIPINVSIIEDQVAQENVATSTRLLNKIRYSDSGNMGIGNAVESFTEYSGTMYFVDPNRSEPVQISYNGIRPISAKMSKYFKNTLKNASDNNVKIIGYYNIYNKEYIVTTESTAGFINQLAFNDTNWEFNEPYTVNNATLAIVGSPSNGTLSAITATGSVDYTGNIGTTGSDTFSFSFTPTGGGASVTKNVCINVSQGNIDLFSFILGFVVNQALSSYSDPSNIIGNLGNTAPVAISISAGGQYRINGGAWTSSSGYYYPGEQVEVRVFTSGSLNTETTTTLTIGNRSAVFSATTETGTPPEPPTPIPTEY
ncbi:MAG: Ig-like domain-containing protein, partial [Bacteroidota bacterium]